MNHRLTFKALYALCVLVTPTLTGEIKQRELPLGGQSQKGRWSYHGGVFYIQDIQLSPDGSTLWAATSKGVVRLDIARERLTRYTTFDGLADNATYDLELESNGAVWAATYSGLSKWDHDAWDSSANRGLENRYVYRIAVDGDGRPWVSGYGEHPAKISFLAGKRWSHFSSSAEGLPGDGVDFLHSDSTGRIWAVTFDSENEVRPNYAPKRSGPHLVTFNELAIFETVPLPKHLLALPRRQTITAIANARDGRLLLGSILGLFAYDGEKWTRYGAREGLVDEHISDLAGGPGNTTWILTRRGIYSFDGRTISLKVTVPDGLRALTENAPHLAVGPDGDVWLTTHPSVALIHGDGPNWTIYVPTLDGPVTQPDSGVQRILTDSSGTHYFAAPGPRGGFTRLLGGNWEILYNGDVADAALDKQGAPWLATRKVLRYANEWVDESTNLGLSGSARTIHRDQRGNMWIGSDSDLIEWDGTKVVRHEDDHPGFRTPFSSIASGSSGHLWVWFQQGMALWKGERLWNLIGKLGGMPGLSGVALSVGPRGGVAIGGAWGGARYDGSRWQHYVREGSTTLQASPVLPGNIVRDTIIDNLNNTWFATDRGIATFDGRQWTKITTDDGLASNSVWCIFEDKDSFWFGTMGGVSRFMKLQ